MNIIERLFSRKRSRGQGLPLKMRGQLDLEAEDDLGYERDGWRARWWDEISQDVRHSVRALIRSPAYLIAAVVTLALGIGATTTVFSVSDALLRRAFPLLPQDQLVWITQPSKSCPNCDKVSGAAYAALTDDARSLRQVVAASHWNAPIHFATGNELAVGYLISPNVFDAISAPFALGTGFRGADDETARRQIVLSYEYWSSHFARSRSVIDSTITIGGQVFRVAGVLGQNVVFPTAADIYAPFTLSAADRNDFGSSLLDVFGRLSGDATIEAVRRDVGLVSQRLRRMDPRTNDDSFLSVHPLRDFHTSDVRIAIDLAIVAVLMVLLAATVSVANLALARGAARQPELMLRAALGGRRTRLLRHLMVEALIVAAAGGALGVPLAEWGTRAARNAIPASFAAFLPGFALIGVDGRALAFTTALSVVVAVVFALVPSLRVTGKRLSGGLFDSGRSSSRGVQGTRLRGWIVVAEVTVALALLTTATLMGRSVQNMLAGDPGVRLDNVLMTHVSLGDKRDDRSARDIIGRIDSRLHALAHVRGAALVSTTPLSNNFWGVRFAIPGRRPLPNEELVASDQVVTADYFRTAGVNVLSGRGVEARDDERAPRVVVISRLMADRYWPGLDPIGHTISFADSLPWTIVGVARDVHHGGFDEAVRPTLYRSAFQHPPRESDINVWTDGDPTRMRDVIRQSITAVDADVAVGKLMTMREIEARHVSPFRVMGSTLALFAGITVLIAIVGLSGLIAYGVAQRRREIGIRMALGANARAIIASVTNRALRLTLTGIGLGAIAGLLLSRMLQSLLYGVSPSDPGTFVGVALILLLVSGIAAAIPTWRALRINPVMALRE